MNKEIIIITKHKRLRELVLIKEIREDEKIWFKVPETCSSVDINLVINVLKEQIADFKESVQKNEKDISIGNHGVYGIVRTCHRLYPWAFHLVRHPQHVSQ
mgnify:CR=1 FL=1